MWQAIKAFFAKLFTKEEKPNMASPVNEAKPALPQWNAPWVFVDLDLLGRDETDPELNRRIVPIWKKLGLNFTTLAGNAHAWCQARIEYVLNKFGIKGTGSAGASSLQKYGIECPFWFGALLPIEHSNGNHHANIFLYWEDSVARIACTMDGNRNSKFGIFYTDISGKGDRVKPSPRWPLNQQPGFTLTKEQVLAVYPWMVPGSSGTGGTTR